MGQPIELFTADILVDHVLLGGARVKTKKENIVKIIILTLQVVGPGSQSIVVLKSIGILAFHFVQDLRPRERAACRQS